ncbi:hypothetical protein K439DRAFT_1624571 [Ramaria rubella]|nr:hypothetical protein K439DRAFT_1624571 [Ramaria rubella]
MHSISGFRYLSIDNPWAPKHNILTTIPNSSQIPVLSPSSIRPTRTDQVTTQAQVSQSTPEFSSPSIESIEISSESDIITDEPSDSIDNTNIDLTQRLAIQVPHLQTPSLPQNSSNMASLTTGHAAMPVPGTSKALNMFDGDDTKLEDFLDHFETLAEAAKLTDQERITKIGKYATRKQRNLFEVLEGYDPADWAMFKKSLADLYPNAFKAQQYTQQSLETFTAKSAHGDIRRR